MSVLLDTGPLFAAKDARDGAHARGKALLERLFSGEHGAVCTTSLVVAETFNLALARRASPGAQQALADTLWPSSKVKTAPMRVLDVPVAALPEIARLFGTHRKRGLSFTDCATLWAMGEYRIGKLCTFDEAFEGLVELVA